MTGIARQGVDPLHISTELHERYIRAGNPETDPEVLTDLANDTCERIRQRVAENPQTPRDVLLAMAYDTSYEVRLSIAENPSTPLMVLELLAQDDCDDVRYGLAENHNTPDHVLKALQRDNNPYVAQRAKQTWLMDVSAHLRETA